MATSLLRRVTDLFGSRQKVTTAEQVSPAVNPSPAESAPDRDAWEQVGGPPCATNFDMTLWERRLLIDAGTVGVSQGPDAQVNLMRSVDYLIASKIEGDFVECGVFLGGSIFLMAKTLMRRGVINRRIWLFDTFEGMPKPTEKDIWWNGTPAFNDWDNVPKIGAVGSDHVYGPLDRVTENCRTSGYPMGNFIFVKGLVEETIPREIPDKIALLRLDTDYYTSTKHELEHLYPRLARGGILIIDDYGASNGVREAVDEYFAAHDNPPFLARVDPAVRISVKR